MLWNELEGIEQLSHELSKIGIACQNVFLLALTEWLLEASRD